MSEQTLDHEVDKLSEDEEIEQYLKLELKDLAKIRNDITKTRVDLVYAQELLEERIEYKEVLACKEELKAYTKAQTTLEDQIKPTALRLSSFSGYKDRKPVSGIHVKEFTVVTILDEKKATIWVANNAPSIISISKAKFNKTVKALELDFIKIEAEYRAEILSDLSEYLDEN